MPLAESKREPREVIAQPFPFVTPRSDLSKAIEFCSDSLVVVSWLHGQWKVNNSLYKPAVRTILDEIGPHLFSSGREKEQHQLEAVPYASQGNFSNLVTRSGAAYLFRHLFRGLNTVAVRLASERGDRLEVRVHALQWPRFLRGFSDGSSREEGSGCGWTLLGSASPDDGDDSTWAVLAEAHFDLPTKPTALQTDVLGLSSLVQFVSCLLRDPLACPTASARPRIWATLHHALRHACLFP